MSIPSELASVCLLPPDTCWHVMNSTPPWLVGAPLQPLLLSPPATLVSLHLYLCVALLCGPSPDEPGHCVGIIFLVTLTNGLREAT